MKINILVGARFQAKLLANFFQKNYIDCTIYTSSPPKNWQEASLSGTKIIRFIPLFFKIIFSKKIDTQLMEANIYLLSKIFRIKA